MKQLFSSILFFIYFVTTATTALHLHYCDGKWMAAINTVSLNIEGHKKLKEKDCCKHPKIKIRLNQNQLLTEAYATNDLFFTQTYLPSSYKHYDGFPTVVSIILSSVNSPPSVVVNTIRRLAHYGFFLI